ncbi:hypothetical protein [Metabacillus malikii]|uniref:Magnesium-transporting ATPase (P-type) n=1 Tax=Metabacillus malikii TaxID=1504265 RepID=A0ABT9ZGK9_9BACI|nr:hypothetical protein [Metabacillus malikii]MDQ0231417.1 magnesium-transporting ATPase (P-type) [Metabacillus malikii]
MKDWIMFFVDIMNNVHDILIILLNDVLGLQMTDKDMHFWIMGIIGIATFAFVYIVSKWLSKLPYGIHLIAFLYTFTFMLVLVFAIEIQQALTSRGNMEFADAIIGLWGFFALFLVYVAISALFICVRLLVRKIKKKYS